ncbi:GNAT family N-acetyltransferase [Candidatus Woesearchaeota archaeon]|nr:GNAT family N-acetyltransferase [Candidatus Woesearchaeota archaeon]MBW3016334.1 GNAT family N-acetyltransferase [Candidatus Woesearchaeota archaeon]
MHKSPETLKLILKERFLPYPTTSAKVYALYNNDKLISFCGIKKWNGTTELSMIITKKPYRNKGNATKLMKTVLKKHPKAYLMTTEKLIPFYTKFGFKQTKKAPAIIKYRVITANWIRKLLNIAPLIMMKR